VFASRFPSLILMTTMSHEKQHPGSSTFSSQSPVLLQTTSYKQTMSSSLVENLSRKELQQQLKVWKALATGTTVAMRERYTQELAKRSTAYPSMRRTAPSTPDLASSPIAARRPHSHNKNKTKPEKRLRRFRSSCPQPIRERIHRAATQRMYLVKKGQVDANTLTCSFVVLGSTGNVYNVEIGKTAKCNCPDHLRCKASLCKHIAFCLLKVLGLPTDSYLVYQAAWMSSELQEMYESCLYSTIERNKQ
jgi:hypothetical protein